MKILFLTSYFAPEKSASPYLGENRNEAFALQNWEMVVYTPSPNRGISAKIREEYKSKRVESALNGQMTIHRFKMYREGKNSLLRAFRYSLCCIIQLYYGIKEKADVIFISSTPPIQGAMGAIVSKITKEPLVYVLQDIFPDSLVGTGMTKKGSLLWKIGRVIENFTYSNSDKIIVISNDFKRNIMDKGVPEKKIEVIYNWVDEKAVVNIPRDKNVLFERYNLDKGKFYITYCGNIGYTQNMDLLLEVAKELESIEDVEFVLVGEGAYKSNVERIMAERSIKNVTIIPFQPYEEISHVFSLGNVGLIISKPGVGSNSLPSKTWSIMSAERPVVANFDENELKDIIENNHCGIFTKAGNIETFKSAIISLYNDRQLCIEMGHNGRKYILDNLTKDIGTSRYVEVLKQYSKK